MEIQYSKYFIFKLAILTCTVADLFTQPFMFCQTRLALQNSLGNFRSILCFIFSVWKCVRCFEEKFTKEMDGWIISPSIKKYNILIFLDIIFPKRPTPKLHRLNSTLPHSYLSIHDHNPPTTIQRLRHPNDEPKILKYPTNYKKNLELRWYSWILQRVWWICRCAYFLKFYYDRYECEVGVF